MSREIFISIENKHPAVDGAPVIVCGNSDYVIEFTFDGEWPVTDPKTARFVYVQRGAVKYQDVVFGGNTVAVPVLSDIREVRVGVYSGNLSTTTPAVIPCERSILCGTSTPDDPTPSQYDQIMALLEGESAVGKTPFVGGNGNWREWSIVAGDFIDTGVPATGPIGPKGDKGDSPQKGIDYLTEPELLDIIARVGREHEHDDRYYTETETDGLFRAHDSSEASHPHLLNLTDGLDSRVKALELKYTTDITGNSFEATFATLDGLTVTGVYNETRARVEF